jgi:hypothetical protein
MSRSGGHARYQRFYTRHNDRLHAGDGIHVRSFCRNASIGAGMAAGHGLRNHNDLAVVLVGNHPITAALRDLIKSQIELFADHHKLHIWVQEGTLYPSDEWEELTDCTLNYVGK